MLKIERIKRIKDILKDSNQVEVSTLSNLLNVSDATIRNDLEELEQEGFLTRFYGGATINVAPTEEVTDTALHPNQVEYNQDLEELGIIAARMIRDREWVFLGPGRTNYYIAKALYSRSNINILTNNFLVANLLYHATGIRLLFLGGQVDHFGCYTLPDDLEHEFDNIYLDKAFFSVDGVDLESGYTLSDRSVLELIQTVSLYSRETVMVVDRSKFNKRTFRKVGSLDMPLTVVTSPDIPDAYKRYYLEHGIRTYTAHNL